MTRVIDKVFAYITHQNRLLVFRHTDFPEAGTQVPAGTVRDGEDLATAVLREALEETGLHGLTIVRYLGEHVRNMQDIGRDEIHDRHFYHLRYGGDARDEWQHAETDPSDGGQVPIRFEFSWAVLPDGVPELIADHGWFLPALVEEHVYYTVEGDGMEIRDEELIRFEAEGLSLPNTDEQGYVEHDGARIWYASYGAGAPVILLHGGLGHSGNWGNQVPALVASGYRAIVIDSRGHGRSTRDARPYTYDLMASDVLAVMDMLNVEKAALVGWSDGACTALILASNHPARVAGVFFFACNMDPSGTKEFELGPLVERCFNRHVKDYALLSPTPDQFEEFSGAVGLMQRTQPNYSADDLAQIRVPVAIVHSEHDEFIKREHAEYLARSIPGAEFIYLPDVSHFAPLQRPEKFNAAMLAFLGKLRS